MPPTEPRRGDSRRGGSAPPRAARVKAGASAGPRSPPAPPPPLQPRGRALPAAARPRRTRLGAVLSVRDSSRPRRSRPLASRPLPSSRSAFLGLGVSPPRTFLIPNCLVWIRPHPVRGRADACETVRFPAEFPSRSGCAAPGPGCPGPAGISGPPRARATPGGAHHAHSPRPAAQRPPSRGAGGGDRGQKGGDTRNSWKGLGVQRSHAHGRQCCGVSPADVACAHRGGPVPPSQSPARRGSGFHDGEGGGQSPASHQPGESASPDPAAGPAPLASGPQDPRPS